MKEEMKLQFKEAKKHSMNVTRIAATGGSGAGKTTSTLEFMHKFGRQFIYSNIGVIQSSKIRAVIMPLNLEEKENACLCIHFMKNPNIELVMKEFRNAITSILKKAYRNFEEEDAHNIVEQILSPTNRIYDIINYCDENIRAELEDEVKEICNSIIEENENQRSLLHEIKIQKANNKNKGKQLELKYIIEKEIEKRMEQISLKTLQSQVQKLVNKIREHINNYIEELCNEGLEIERSENEILVFIDKENGSVSNKLFKYLFMKDGKDLVVSHLTFMTSMSDEAVAFFYEKQKFEFDRSKPLFKIYDLKGLESGENSIDETIIKIRESMPDAILAYQRTTDISDFFIKYIDAVHHEFSKIPTHAILTHSDSSLKSHLRNMLNEFGSKSKGEDGYEEYYKEQVNKAYSRLKKENEIYVKKICENDEKAEVIFCSLIDECEEIDNILGEDKKMYNPEKFWGLIAQICKQHNSRWKKAEYVIENIKNFINIRFNDDKLKECVDKIVQGNKVHSKKNYYKQAELHPHWNSVYKWRAMHRVGYGWQSSAMVYDNININVSDFISGFMNRDIILNAIDIDFSCNIDEEQQNSIKDIIYKNIKEDMALYNGFFNRLKLMITYEGFAKDFSCTYFKDALELIYDKLCDADYINKIFIQFLDEYKEIFISETFE